MLETLLVVLNLFSYYLFIKKTKQKLLFGSFSGVLVSLSFLTKGPVGVFLLVLPLIIFLINRDNFSLKKSITFYSSFFLALAFCIFYEPIGNNLKNYFEIQLFPSLLNKREVTVSNRFSILLKAFQELLLPLLALLFVTIKAKTIKLNSKVAVLFLIIGLSASLPLIISLKQRSYYLLPSIPFFILGISTLLVDYLRIFTKIKIKPWLWAIPISIFLVSLALSVENSNKPIRDNKLISDVLIIGKEIGKNQVVSVPQILSENWGLHAYLYRFFYLSIEVGEENDFLIMPRQSNLIKGYNQIPLKLEKFQLYKKIKRKGEVI